MSRFFLAISLLFAFNLHGAPVIIHGESNAPDQIVRLIVLNDYISNLEQTITSSRTDAAGKFSLIIDIQEITTVQLSLGLDRVEVIISPGCIYTYKLTQSKLSLTSSYFEKDPFSLTVLESNDKGLQKNIDDINLIFNAFVMQHFDDLYHRKRFDLLDSLRMAIELRLPANPIVFVSEYNTYKQASLLQTMRGRSAEQWIRNLVIDKPVLYSNPEYMNLLNEVFSDYLITNRHYQQDELKRSIHDGYGAFLQFVSINPLLSKSPQLSELVGLINLRDLYNNSAFEKEEIIRLLSQFNIESKHLSHKQISANLIKSLSYLEMKTDAPSFTLKNPSLKNSSLRDFSDKKVVLQFVQDSCPVCIQSVMKMKALSDKFGDDYTFITISTAQGFQNYVKLFNKNNLSWTLLNLEDNILLLEDYRVKTFPEFFILLREGKIGMAPAPQPDQNLEFHLQRLKDR
jgi:peroxiredoxin